MEGVAENSRGQTKSKVLPIAWTTCSAVAITLACLAGAVGYVAAKLHDEVDEAIPIYIQCGTTFLILVISVCETAALVTLVRWVKWTMNIDKRRNEMVSASPFQETTIQTGPNISYREFAAGDILGLYIGILGINSGIIMVIWCITIAQSYPSHSQLAGTLWPFILIDIVVGVMAPLLIIFSIIPIARILRYVTHNRLETRKLLLWFLPFLGYEKGSREIYWVLDDSFYYKIHNQFCGNLSTGLLYTTTGLTFLFSWVYFVDDVLIQQFGLTNCAQLSPVEKETAYCFHIHPTDLNLYINCSANSTYSGHLFCFEFKGTGNVIQSLVISIILYYISVICISLVLQLMKFLQQYAQSYLWPAILIASGFATFLFGLLHFISSLYFNYYLNVLTLFQILIVSANICVVGVLIGGGQLVLDHQTMSSENTSILLNPYVMHAINNDIGRRHPTEQNTHSVLPQSPAADGTQAEGVELVTVSRHHSGDAATSTPSLVPPVTPPQATGLPSPSPPPPSSTPPPPLSSAVSTPDPTVVSLDPTTTSVDEEIKNEEETKNDKDNTNTTDTQNVMISPPPRPQASTSRSVMNNGSIEVVPTRPRVLHAANNYQNNPRYSFLPRSAAISHRGVTYIPISPSEYVMLGPQQLLQQPTPVMYASVPPSAIAPLSIHYPHQQHSVAEPSPLPAPTRANRTLESHSSGGKRITIV